MLVARKMPSGSMVSLMVVFLFVHIQAVGDRYRDERGAGFRASRGEECHLVTGFDESLDQVVDDLLDSTVPREGWETMVGRSLRCASARNLPGIAATGPSSMRPAVFRHSGTPQKWMSDV